MKSSKVKANGLCVLVGELVIDWLICGGVLQFRNSVTVICTRIDLLIVLMKTEYQRRLIGLWPKLLI